MDWPKAILSISSNRPDKRCRAHDVDHLLEKGAAFAEDQRRAQDHSGNSAVPHFFLGSKLGGVIGTGIAGARSERRHLHKAFDSVSRSSLNQVLCSLVMNRFKGCATALVDNADQIDDSI